MRYWYSSFWLPVGASRTPSVRRPLSGSNRWIVTLLRSSSVAMVSSAGASVMVAMCGLPFLHSHLIKYQKHLSNPSMPPVVRSAQYHRWNKVVIPSVIVWTVLFSSVVSVTHMSVSSTNASPFRLDCRE